MCPLSPPFRAASGSSRAPRAQMLRRATSGSREHRCRCHLEPTLGSLARALRRGALNVPFTNRPQGLTPPSSETLCLTASRTHRLLIRGGVRHVCCERESHHVNHVEGEGLPPRSPPKKCPPPDRREKHTASRGRQGGRDERSGDRWRSGYSRERRQRDAVPE